MFLIAFPLANINVNLVEAEPSASLFPFGSTLCWSLGHILAALAGHFMGRAEAGQQDAV